MNVDDLIERATRFYRRYHGAVALPVDVDACEVRNDERGQRVRLVDHEGVTIAVLWCTGGSFSYVEPARAA